MGGVPRVIYPQVLVWDPASQVLTVDDPGCSAESGRPYFSSEATACDPRSMTRQAFLGLTFEVYIGACVNPRFTILLYVTILSFTIEH